MGIAALPRQAPRIAFLTTGGGDGFFHRIYDGGDGDALRRRQQPIAATWPTGGFDQPRAAKPAKKLFQISG